jgi:quinol monooxygenase YgiN
MGYRDLAPRCATERTAERHDGRRPTNQRKESRGDQSISVFTIQPGRRDEFVDLFQSLVDQHMSIVEAAGCTAVTLYTVVDDPDKAVEIAERRSAEAREASQTNAEWRVFAPLFELATAPPSATLIEPLR